MVMRKILFLALHLGYGGAEKAIISEANMLAEHYEVEIACVYKLYEKPAFLLDERVRVRYLSEQLKPNKEELKQAIRDRKLITAVREGMKSMKVLYYRKHSIKKEIQRTDADVIISTRYLFHKILGRYKKPGVITIAQEHNHHNNDEQYIQRMVASVRHIDYFMPVSRELTEFYARRMPQVKCVLIPHSLDHIPETVSSLDQPALISVGRLSPEKGYPELIEVFAEISKDDPEWQLHIIGDGEERGKIEEAIQQYNLGSRVTLHGYQNKEYIEKMLRSSSIYVMTSYTEAFGIVLIEAQSLGLPCVAYDSARGALEIIENNVNGYLIKNRNRAEMCEHIKMLMNSKKLRVQLGSKGRENSLQYAADNIEKQWVEFIDKI